MLEIDWMGVNLEITLPFKGICIEFVKSVYTRMKNTGEMLDEATRPTPTFKRMSVEVNTGP